jgi:CheY-like chemotaxis protein
MARILLADDDSASRDLVRRALEGEGHTVTVTGDGAEALEAFNAARTGFDLIVTDVQMPALDGVSFAKAALAASSTVKVLLMSGFSESLEKGRWIEPARLGVLAKPFTLEQIRATVRTILGS